MHLSQVVRSALGWTIEVQASYAGFGRLRQGIDGPVASHCEHESREITDRDYALNFKKSHGINATSGRQGGKPVELGSRPMRGQEALHVIHQLGSAPMVEDCVTSIRIDLDVVSRGGWEFVVHGIRLAAAPGAATKRPVI